MPPEAQNPQVRDQTPHHGCIILLTLSQGFLNDIIAQLWPNINVAGGKIIKDSVEPILESMLPGPLSNLRFVKLDFGPTPLRMSNVDVHRTELEGIKLDMDVDWDGKCDFELDGSMVPKIVRTLIRLSPAAVMHND